MSHTVEEAVREMITFCSLHNFSIQYQLTAFNTKYLQNIVFSPVHNASLLCRSVHTLEFFSPKRMPSQSFNTLVHRALMIYSRTKLNAELDKLTTIFMDNGYIEDVISSYTRQKISSFRLSKSSVNKNAPLNKLPRIGNTSLLFESQMK